MNHILVVPNDLLDKLNAVQSDNAVMTKWSQIGVHSPDEMMGMIMKKLNEKYEKLSIVGYRQEDKNTIKERVGNGGSASIYLGYFEKEDENIDALFFYNEPQTSNANDLATRNIWPALIGIYGAVGNDMVDLHFNNRPVFVVNLNETTRLSQRSVKVNIICALIMGFNYVDVFENTLMDVMPVDFVISFHGDDDDDPLEIQATLESFDGFVSPNQDNEYFEVDDNNRKVTILVDRLVNSKNPAAELYRFCPRVIPAAILAKENNYEIDIHNLNQLNTQNINIIKSYLGKFIQ